MKDSLIGNIGATTINILGVATDDIASVKKTEESKEVLTPKQQRRADRKAVRLRKKG